MKPKSPKAQKPRNGARCGRPTHLNPTTVVPDGVVPKGSVSLERGTSFPSRERRQLPRTARLLSPVGSKLGKEKGPLRKRKDPLSGHDLNELSPTAGESVSTVALGDRSVATNELDAVLIPVRDANAVLA